MQEKVSRTRINDPLKEAMKGKSQTWNGDRTVFIGDLPPHYHREELQAHFQQFGPLQGAHYSNKYAIIEFDSKEVRDAAIAGSEGLTIQE